MRRQAAELSELVATFRLRAPAAAGAGAPRALAAA
jgi:hypothetical protein